MEELLFQVSDLSLRFLVRQTVKHLSETFLYSHKTSQWVSQSTWEKQEQKSRWYFLHKAEHYQSLGNQHRNTKSADNCTKYALIILYSLLPFVNLFKLFFIFLILFLLHFSLLNIIPLLPSPLVISPLVRDISCCVLSLCLSPLDDGWGDGHSVATVIWWMV